jgi:hypothetical protein
VRGLDVTTDAPFTNKQAAIFGITAQLPDGGTIQSTHTCSLALPFLPAAAREAHIFPFLASGSLISIGLLCDHGCTALFNASTVTVKYKDCMVAFVVVCRCTIGGVRKHVVM